MFKTIFKPKSENKIRMEIADLSAESFDEMDLKNKKRLRNEALDDVRIAHHDFLDAEDTQNLSVSNRCSKILEMRLAAYREANINLYVAIKKLGVKTWQR